MADEPNLAAGLRALPLRERKRVMTRRAILDAAERLFEERGFEHVTVAQIADAANVSVKTLFVYFRSKEDLAFTDTSLLDLCVAAIERRSAGTSPGNAVAEALVSVVRAGRQPVTDGIEGFHRGYRASPALHARLLRMWEEYEDRITAVLAGESGAAATPATRLRAIALVGMLRALTSGEMRASVAGKPPGDSLAYVCDWLLASGGAAALPESRRPWPWSAPASPREHAPQLADRGRGGQCAVVLPVQAARQGGLLPWYGEWVCAIGQEGRGAAHTSRCRLSLAGDDPVADPDAGQPGRRDSQPFLKQCGAWALRDGQHRDVHN